MEQNTQLVLLAKACQRLRYILTVTHDIRIAGETHLAIEEIEATMESITKEGK
jgi:hypothetical protein